jgi:hypothetical protein
MLNENIINKYFLIHNVFCLFDFDRHDITELLLKVALNTINQPWFSLVLSDTNFKSTRW